MLRTRIAKRRVKVRILVGAQSSRLGYAFWSGTRAGRTPRRFVLILSKLFAQEPGQFGGQRIPSRGTKGTNEREQQSSCSERSDDHSDDTGACVTQIPFWLCTTAAQAVFASKKNLRFHFINCVRLRNRQLCPASSSSTHDSIALCMGAVESGPVRNEVRTDSSSNLSL